MLGGGLLHPFQHHARLDRHGVADRVDIPDPVQTSKGQDGKPAAGIGNTRPDQAGIAALRHDRDAVFVAKLQERANLLGGRRLEHQSRLARPIPQLSLACGATTSDRCSSRVGR